MHSKRITEDGDCPAAHESAQCSGSGHCRQRGFGLWGPELFGCLNGHPGMCQRTKQFCRCRGKGAEMTRPGLTGDLSFTIMSKQAAASFYSEVRAAKDTKEGIPTTVRETFPSWKQKGNNIREQSALVQSTGIQGIRTGSHPGDPARQSERLSGQVLRFFRTSFLDAGRLDGLRERKRA